MTVRIANHPGEGAETFGKLAAAGVNLGLVLPVRVSNDQFYAVLGVDDVDKATVALGGQVVTDYSDCSQLRTGGRSRVSDVLGQETWRCISWYVSRRSASVIFV